MPTVGEHRQLFAAHGWSWEREEVRRQLAGSLHDVVAVRDGETVGVGRVLGDGGASHDGEASHDELTGLMPVVSPARAHSAGTPAPGRNSDWSPVC